MPSSEHFRGCPTKRFLQKVDRQDGCLIWRGGVNAGGYGVFWFGKRLRPAHAAAMEMFGHYTGPLHIDHLCRNRACVNPAHLEPVTQAENNRRAAQHRTPGEDTPCRRGHPASERRRSGRTVYCLVCRRSYERSVRRSQGVARRESREK